MAQKKSKMCPVVHFEMPAEDKKRMSAFYSGVFGWDMKQLGKDMGEYVLATTVKTDPKTMMPKTVGAINGGFYSKMDAEMGSHPSVVISVEDINEAMKKVKDAGGKVHGKPDEIPGIGLYVSFTDTEGNDVRMLQPLEGK